MEEKLVFESIEEWRAEAVRLFGDNPMEWRFVCPSCGHVASIQDWKDAGATSGEAAYSCVGRRLEGSKQMGEKPGPCNYAGGGLISLNPVIIKFKGGESSRVFAFASERPTEQEPQVEPPMSELRIDPDPQTEIDMEKACRVLAKGQEEGES